MNESKRGKKALAALLALVLALSLAPAAGAANNQQWVCPNCRQTCIPTVTVEREATCTKTGIDRYLCPQCGKSTLVEGAINPLKHDMVYTDNNDGTHSGVCNSHKNQTSGPDEHHFINGICKQCGAADYSAVSIDLPEARTVPVALGDTGAKLSAGNIRLTLGSANITDDYTLSYFWYDYSQGGRPVGEGEEFLLPASVYGNKGVYTYSLVVSATPRGTVNRQPVNKDCRITVQVDDLITASAVLTTEDGELFLGTADGWSSDSVSNQIYDAVQNLCARGARPAAVTFNDVSGSSVGSLSVTNTSTRYSFGEGNDLGNVRFTAKGVSGDFVVGFTAYDTDNQSYSGMLTITVQQYAGDMDVLYIASRSEPLLFSVKDFQDFWADRCPNGELEYVRINKLPRSVDGTLYVEYDTALRTGDTLRVDDELYVDPVRRQYGIASTAFVPGVGVKQSSYLTLEFTAVGTRAADRPSTARDGVIYIFFADDVHSADVSVIASSDGTALDPADFQKAYQAATGVTGAASFYIQLQDVPSGGGLYLDRSATRPGVQLTRTSASGRLFSCGGGRGESIGSLTYVPGSAVSESIRYVASSTQGKPLFAGNIRFTSTSVPAPSANALLVEYTCPPTGVTFKSSDFENLLGAGGAKVASVSFTPPSALFGTLYQGRTAVSAGTAITTDTYWLSVSSGTAGVNSVNDVSFVPALSQTSGTVTIPFTAISTTGARSSGNVRITLSSSTTTPGTTTPGTTTPGTTLPAKTFSDVAQGAYYYTQVTALTTSGVLKGYEDGTFRPDKTVTLGEALKMILTSVGYPEQAATDSHWASGYLAKAKADNLLPAGMIERLDRPADRYTIAEITARAMKLSLSPVASSPFADMAVNNTAAPAVSALHGIGVLIGSENAAKQTVYQGEYAIKRCDFAIIIWRVQNYMKTGNVNGTTAG